MDKTNTKEPKPLRIFINRIHRDNRENGYNQVSV